MTRVSVVEHQAQPWLVHDLAADYELEDVWRLPVELEPNDSLAEFWDQMQLAISQLNKASPAAILFGARILLGRLFRWDQSPSRPGALELRTRYAALATLEPELEVAGAFHVVYRLDDEYLAELENSTVQAALHLGRIETPSGHSVNLAVYAKPKGNLGRFYMAAIRPFRLRVVYPTILEAAGRQWSKHKSAG